MIVLDTNALMMPVECDVRLFEELDRVLAVDAGDYVVPEAVREELAKLADGAGTEATAASVGRDLLDRCSVRETDADYADDAVLELATGNDATHAVTNDKPLKRRLLDAGVPVISLRGRNKLGITQP
ncbi:PIN domain-containing protein [Haloarcula nitratireducens]|uniref:Twitching motility protein PilT n=1 Tax=Haloarcula nitratireducens TaxID=2487749 RepID=A0AAW4PDV2_9EURY|nr:twitching motility protein PilT [Halomicroarcula nitratireducens]MBX0295818.1 twitching motility protein PilT [Halomicroarcula nitratireducens]